MLPMRQELRHNSFHDRQAGRQEMKQLMVGCIVLLSAIVAMAEVAVAQQNSVTAIDIALEPDATMIQHAKDANARLRESFPEGFALDETHHLHVTMLQQFVRTEDLDRISWGRMILWSSWQSWTRSMPSWVSMEDSALSAGPSRKTMSRSPISLTAGEQLALAASAPFSIGHSDGQTASR
jgi:hypothetical protein